MTIKLMRKRKKGFTLMELLVSLGIIAALSMMVAPMIIGKVDEAKVKADISNANAIAVAVKSEMLEGKVLKTDYDSAALTTLVGKYFDDQLPTPQSVKGAFSVAVAGNTITVSVGSDKFYPVPAE